MAEPRHWHLFMYDVSDDKRRTKVHKVLSSWGEPLQFSIFSVRCTARELERVRVELTRCMEDEDRLAVVRLCDGCASRVTIQGDALMTLGDELPPFRMV